MMVVYCAGEQASVVLDSLRRRGVDERIVLLDDESSLHGRTVHGHDVIGGESTLDTLDPTSDRCVIAFGDRQGVRERIAETIRDRGFDLFTVLDPEATVSSSATVGDGVMMNAQTYVGPDADVADLVLVDSGVSVSHDVTLRPAVTVGPGATLAGGVHVGRDAFVGAGATVIDDVTVGERAVVGAGAVVVDDVPAETTVVGVPAKPTYSNNRS